jgi:hypothetical protein
VTPAPVRVRPRIEPIGAVTPPVRRGPRTIEDLMHDAAHTPPTPSRSDVIAAMSHVAPAVTACGAEHGVATVQVSVANSGRVSSAVVTGSLAGTPTGSCVARAVRGATLPAFTRSTFSFSYPFRV